MPQERYPQILKQTSSNTRFTFTNFRCVVSKTAEPSVNIQFNNVKSNIFSTYKRIQKTVGTDLLL